MLITTTAPTTAPESPEKPTSSHSTGTEKANAMRYSLLTACCSRSTVMIWYRKSIAAQMPPFTTIT